MKCRLTVHVSESVNASLSAAASKPGRSKSSIVELAVEQFLSASPVGAGDESLLRRLDHMSRTINQTARDGQVALETIALFARYYLTITPPVATVDQEAARALGRERFETFITQIGRRLATGSRLVDEVMERLADMKPDLFSTNVAAPGNSEARSTEQKPDGADKEGARTEKLETESGGAVSDNAASDVDSAEIRYV